MTLQSLTTPFTWSQYSSRLSLKIQTLYSAGFFTEQEAKDRKMHLAIGSSGSLGLGNFVCLYWLVDPQDGIIADAKFQAFGHSALLGAAEIACELLICKNYDQAKRMTADLIEQQVTSRNDQKAFPQETYPHINLVLEAIEMCAASCEDIPLSESYIAPPMPLQLGEVVEGGFPGWDELPLKQKIAVIESILDRDLRPYIAMDGGGIEVMGLNEQLELTIAYQGSCTSCISSVGATLSFIQQTLRNQVHPDLKVIPTINEKI